METIQRPIKLELSVDEAAYVYNVIGMTQDNAIKLQSKMTKEDPMYEAATRHIDLASLVLCSIWEGGLGEEAKKAEKEAENESHKQTIKNDL